MIAIGAGVQRQTPARHRSRRSSWPQCRPPMRTSQGGQPVDLPRGTTNTETTFFLSFCLRRRCTPGERELSQDVQATQPCFNLVARPTFPLKMGRFLGSDHTEHIEGPLAQVRITPHCLRGSDQVAPVDVRRTAQSNGRRVLHRVNRFVVHHDHLTVGDYSSAQGFDCVLRTLEELVFLATVGDADDRPDSVIVRDRIPGTNGRSGIITWRMVRSSLLCSKWRPGSSESSSAFGSSPVLAAGTVRLSPLPERASDSHQKQQSISWIATP